MQYYPIFIDIAGHDCLVVGGGPIALRKIRLQRLAGAKITVIAPEICRALATEFGAEIIHKKREFLPTDITGYRLVTAATNNHKVNAQISKLAKSQNIPVNVIDQPELCSFITPAIIDRSPVLVAISTSGSAPVLARQLRTQIEALLSPNIAKLAKLMRNTRKQVRELIPREQTRRRFWEHIINGRVARHFEAGRNQDAQHAFEHALKDVESNNLESGDVSLIGAGPGDPDLLTLKALRLMQQADVILHDRLVSREILNLARRDAERIYVGKRRADHAMPQGEINAQLFELASQGKRVVRLKGGDPFIFGRGGEEIDLLAKHNIPFQIVPGITAASGCATYSGIPLTHRDHAQSCLFITGHLKNNTVDLDWPNLAASEQTLVIYMGLIGLPKICRKLIEHGVSKDMPIALIERGTTPQHRMHIGTLESLPISINNTNISAPTLIIIGTVVTLQPKLNWFQPISD